MWLIAANSLQQQKASGHSGVGITWLMVGKSAKNPQTSSTIPVPYLLWIHGDIIPINSSCIQGSKTSSKEIMTFAQAHLVGNKPSGTMEN